MAKDKEGIESCPFCGSHNIGMGFIEVYPKDCSIYELSNDEMCEIFFVMCNDCSAKGPAWMSVHNVKDDVSIMEIDAVWERWNTRK